MPKHFILLILIITAACSQVTQRQQITGKAQGTTYSVIYYDEQNRDFSHEIAQKLNLIDHYFSLWVDSSCINHWNSARGEMIMNDSLGYFKTLLEECRWVYNATGGAFDPTIHPLVKAWGFGKFKNESDVNVDSLLPLVDFSQIKWNEVSSYTLTLSKLPLQTLDFNAVAQGYSVDILANFLESKGVASYMVEIGGEVKVGQRKPNGSLWSIGIDKPTDGPRELADTLHLENASLATSGSYRKFYVKNGKKYSHTIHPKTGYPVNHQLLSATIVLKNGSCARADALATAMMVMGTDKAKQFSQDHNVEMLLISHENGELKYWE